MFIRSHEPQTREFMKEAIRKHIAVDMATGKDSTVFRLTPIQISILEHTLHRAAGGYYCGGGPDMDALVAAGLMEYAGRKSFVPDPYYTITSKGCEALRSNTTQP
jgi:hypothetical protein